MKNTTRNFRVRLSTWRKLRSLFPALRNETTADYMDRLAKWIADHNYTDALVYDSTEPARRFI